MVPTIVPDGGTLPLRKSEFKLVTKVWELTENGEVPVVVVDMNLVALTLPKTVNFSVLLDAPILTLPF